MMAMVAQVHFCGTFSQPALYNSFMQISKWWFRTRIEKGLPKTNLSLVPRVGYQIYCKCEQCGKEFNRKFGLDDFQFCAGCRTGNRAKTPERRERASKQFSSYYASEENRLKKSKAVKRLYSDSEFAAKQKRGSQIRSANPDYVQKLKDNAERGDIHAQKVSCGKQGIELSDFNGFITGLDALERQRCKETVAKECLQKANYRCDICCVDQDFHAHHMNGWHWAIDERFDLNNLVCLCHGCHSHFHTVYGNKNNTREQYEAFKLSKTQGGVQ